MNIDEKFPRIERLEFKKLGTTIDVQIVIENSEELLKAKGDIVVIEKLYDDTHKRFSRFDDKSELSLINSQLNKWQNVSTEMIEVANLMLDFYEKTQGYVDPRIISTLENAGYNKDFDSIDIAKGNVGKLESISNSLGEDLKVVAEKIYFSRPMDFAGIVKGYVNDKASEYLMSQGWRNFLVDSGGDMFFKGNDEKGNVWTIDIEGISSKKLMFELSDMAVATSGIGKRKWERNGKRYHHIIHPKNSDFFSFDLQSVSVVAEKTIQADVLAKTLFLLGKDQGKKYAKENEIACVILEYNGRAWMSPSVSKYLSNKSI
jgi:thiamine biosynthesis lipoprotein